MPRDYRVPRAPGAHVRRASSAESPCGDFKGLILTKGFTTCGSAFTEGMFLWAWGVRAFSHPSIFISFPQYGRLFVLFVLVTICSLWGAVDATIFFVICGWRLKHFIGNSWLGKCVTNPVCTNERLHAVCPGCSQPGGLWTIQCKSPAMSAVLFSSEARGSRAEQRLALSCISFISYLITTTILIFLPL